MTIIGDLLEPLDNITKGIGGAVSGLGHGLGQGVGAFAKMWANIGKMFSSPFTMIILAIGGIVVLNLVMKH